jgi:hypothetical protein
VPSFETIRRLSPCASERHMRERAALWPSPDGPNAVSWTWFLGERCEQYDRDECVNFLAIAVGYIKQARVVLPVTVRALWLARASTSKPALLDVLATLGEYLDYWDADGRDTESDEYADVKAALDVFTRLEAER